MNKKIIIGFVTILIIIILIVVGFLYINNNKEEKNEIQNEIQNENGNQNIQSEIENRINNNSIIEEETVEYKNEVEENNNIEKENKTNNEIKEEVSKVDMIQIKVNNKILNVKLEDNSSAKAFVEKLKQGDIIVNAHEYGNFEKVGPLGFSLPTNDTRITTTPGDLILYQGNQITLYYDTNTWNFTKLGKVQNISKEELKNILGSGDVQLVFQLIK